MPVGVQCPISSSLVEFPAIGIGSGVLGFRSYSCPSPPHVIVKGVENWGIWWTTVLLNDLRTVCVQPLMRDTCRVCWSAILLENEPGWHQLFAVLDKLNFHSLYGYARIIAFAPHPCSRSVCIRILSASDTFPILIALKKCW